MGSFGVEGVGLGPIDPLCLARLDRLDHHSLYLLHELAAECADFVPSLEVEAARRHVEVEFVGDYPHRDLRIKAGAALLKRRDLDREGLAGIGGGRRDGHEQDLGQPIAPPTQDRQDAGTGLAAFGLGAAYPRSNERGLFQVQSTFRIHGSFFLWFLDFQLLCRWRLWDGQAL